MGFRYWYKIPHTYAIAYLYLGISSPMVCMGKYQSISFHRDSARSPKRFGAVFVLFPYCKASLT
ncbi:hypothetical protein [Pseudanabaena sp. SR411]|uniref:hypothetical protein n=1 Tax=Pseudanabaena sp. SR411 TaxID=1980935 RepID=UPI00113FD666|nr:hypothetical protein [Pseudanabaena sp. SR411]